MPDEPMTATEIIRRQAEAGERWQRELAGPIIHPLIDRELAILERHGLLPPDAARFRAGAAWKDTSHA